MKFEKKIYKYQQVLLGLNLKQVLKTLPKLFGINLIIIALFVLVGFFAVKFSESQTKAESVKVALVTEDDSLWIETISHYIEKNLNCRFVKMTKEKALDKLAKEEITAILILPKDVISAIMSSQEGAATLIFGYPGQFTSLKTFQNLAKTGMSDIAALDAAEKLIGSIQTKTKGRINYSEVFQIEDKLVMKVLMRSSTFSKTVFSDSGSLNLINFYIGSIILALLLFTGVFLQELLSRKPDAYLISLSRIGISNFRVSLIQFISVVIVYSLIFYIIYILLSFFQLVTFNFMAFVSILILMLDTIGFLFVVYQLCSSKFTASMFVFLSSLVMMFFSGNIVPISFLPAVSRQLSVILPTRYFALIPGEIASGVISIKTLGIGLCWFALFMLIQFINCRARKIK